MKIVESWLYCGQKNRPIIEPLREVSLVLDENIFEIGHSGDKEFIFKELSVKVVPNSLFNNSLAPNYQFFW